MPNTNNCQTNLHVLQSGNLPMPQHPTVSYTDQIHNNPILQVWVVQHLLGPDVVESRCKVVVNGGKSNNTQVKSGRERVAGNDPNRRFVSWPQEHVFVGASRKRVKFDNFTQTQFSAGMLVVIEEEQQNT